MATVLTARWTVVIRLSTLGCLAALSSCATTRTPGRTQAVYRVVWTATRASDHAALAAGVVNVSAGRPATVRIHSGPPPEGRPEFTGFSAHLDPSRSPGVLQLVTRADMREATRNKKGRLKITRRNIGALLPIRPGETQLTSVPSDPVRLEVLLERE